MRDRRVSLWVIALFLSPIHAFVPIAPTTAPCEADRHRRMRQLSRRLSRTRCHLISPVSRSRGSLIAPLASGQEDGEQDGEQDGAVSTTNKDMKDARLVAATGVSGALVGCLLERALRLELGGFGAIPGSVVAVGMLAQGGTLGKAAGTAGRLTLAAFDIVSVIARETQLSDKVAGVVSEQTLEVVELASGAVTKGYLENAPEPILRLEKELQASKEHVAELKGHLEQVTGALEEAQGQLQQRVENQKVVKTAKASVAELAKAKADLVAKDAIIAENLRVARSEKETFDQELKAAREEIARFREMIESQANLDESFKALTDASEVLEDRVQGYEARLATLTSENDSIRSDYATEAESMKTERASMRERISELESSLATLEGRLNDQRVAFEAEFATMAEELQQKSKEIERIPKLESSLAAAESRFGEQKTALEEELVAASDELERKTNQAEVAQQRALELEQAVESALGDSSAAVEAERRLESMQQQLEQMQKLAAQAQEAEQVSSQAALESKAKAAEFAQRAQLEADARMRAESVRVQQGMDIAGEMGEYGELKLGQEPEDMDLDNQIMAAQAGMGAATSGDLLDAAYDELIEGEGGQDDDEEEEEEEERRSGAATEESLMKLTVKNLRELCKGSSVPTTGKKAELVGRLLRSYASAEA